MLKVSLFQRTKIIELGPKMAVDLPQGRLSVPLAVSASCPIICVFFTILLKVLRPITFSSPRLNQKMCIFRFQLKASIFLIANLKFCLETPCDLRDMPENVMVSGVPINNF